MTRVVALLLQSGISIDTIPCDGVACDALPPATGEPVTEGPQGPDLDGNGVPDLCQLRCSDLDMSGRVDQGDLAVMLMLLGEPATLGIGDLDGDGLITPADLGILASQMPAAPATGSGSAGPR